MKPFVALHARKNKAGSPLVGVVLILFIASAIAAGMIANAIGSVRLTDRQANLEAAYFAAESGLEEGAEWVQAQKGYVPRENEFSKTMPNGASVNYKVIVYNLENMEVGLEAEATYRGATRKMQVPRLGVPTFAEFARGSEKAGSGHYTPGNVIYGWLHSDESLRIWSYDSADRLGPDFYGLVSTSAPEFTGPWQYANFHANYEFNAKTLDLPEINFDNYLSKAEGMEANGQGGLVLEGITDVYFLSTSANQGRVYIKNPRKHGNDQYRPYQLSDLKLVYIKDAQTGNPDTRVGLLNVAGGVVNGQVTFYTDGDVIITESIYYKNDPRDDNESEGEEESDDRIGFVSGDDILIDRRTPGNLNLFGAYLAAGQKSGSTGRFGVLSYRDLNMGPMGTLNLYGSFVSETAHPIGTFSSTSGLLRSGFRSITTWDKRFKKTPPPFYPPLKTRIQFRSWSLL